MQVFLALSDIGGMACAGFFSCFFFLSFPSCVFFFVLCRLLFLSNDLL